MVIVAGILCEKRENLYVKLARKISEFMGASTERIIMLNNWDNLQHININMEHAPCNTCGADIADIVNIKYDGEAISTPSYRQELCVCRSCGQFFVLHYDIFDIAGHIFSRVFTEDANNPKFNWTDLLTDEQKDKISKHLESCDICINRISKQQLRDAWFASIIHTTTVKEVDK